MNFRWIGNIVCVVLLAFNLVVAVGFLVCAYSPYISPVRHPVWACTGLLFPIFAVLNLLCLAAWLFVRRWFVLLPLLVFASGWESLCAYCPMGNRREAAGKTIKLLTYNVQGMLPGETGDGGSRILDYLERSEADIICLQEFFPDVHVSRKQVDKALSAYPYHKSVRLPGGDGLACYSRYPILAARQIDYVSSFNGSMLYKLDIDGDTVVLVNNHLESNKLDSHDKEMYSRLIHSPNEANVKSGGRHLLHKLTSAVTIRAPQADSVACAIARERTPYMLVCGDFNDSPVSYAHRIIGQGLTDVYAEAGVGPGFTYNQNRFYFRIDHLFAGSAFRVLQCRVDRSINASDHYPVWCLLEKVSR